jgi:hypothetical protein
MANAVFFLTHDFKPIFRRTLANAARGKGEEYEVMVLLDDRNQTPEDIQDIKVVPCLRRPSSFDPIGQAHNFYIDLIRSNPSMLDKFDHFWVFENDVYFHGDIMKFIKTHDQFSTDLIVPEFGHRMPGWMWLHNCVGVKPDSCGITAVAYRASSRLLRSVIESMSLGTHGHMEVLIPHICIEQGYSIRQFVPDTVGCCNTFDSPLMRLIEKDINDNTSVYIQEKLYHPVKM